MIVADDELIQKSKNGDAAAFEELVERYQRQVYTIAYRFLANHEDASDLAQEAFVKVFASLQRFRGDCSFKTWLYHIVTNVCRDALRKRQRQQTLYLDEPINTADGELTRQIADPDLSPEQIYEQKENQAYIQQLLGTLTPEYRMVVVMREIQGFSYEEIASQCGCSLGTVKSRLSRARRILRDKIVGDRELSIQGSRQREQRREAP